MHIVGYTVYQNILTMHGPLNVKHMNFFSAAIYVKIQITQQIYVNTSFAEVHSTRNKHVEIKIKFRHNVESECEKTVINTTIFGIL